MQELLSKKKTMVPFWCWRQCWRLHDPLPTFLTLTSCGNVEPLDKRRHNMLLVVKQFVSGLLVGTNGLVSSLRCYSKSNFDPHVGNYPRCWLHGELCGAAQVDCNRKGNMRVRLFYFYFMRITETPLYINIIFFYVEYNLEASFYIIVMIFATILPYTDFQH